MADRGHFVFVDEWRVAAPPGAVWPVIRDATAWPDWWPFVRRATRLTSGVDGHETWEFRFRTRLPYDIAFVVDLVVTDPELRVDAQATGRLTGHGGFRLDPVDGGTRVGFHWDVRPQLAWMRAVAPVARPVFSWNHRSLMAAGAHGLARHLAVQLLTPPAGTLLPG